MATTDIYELSKLNQDIEKKYMPISQDNLYMGIYGYLNEHFSTEMQNATIMAIEEGNEAIPINAKYEKNLLTYAIQYGMENINATPAHMDIMVGFVEKDLEEQFTNLGSNTFRLDRNCKIMIEGFEYHLDYDLIIQRQLLPGGVYGYTAKYDISTENPLSDVTNPFLAPPIILEQDRIRFIFVQCTIRQTSEITIEKKIFSNNILENKTFDFEFDDQLADFSVEVEENDALVFLTPIFEGMPLRNTNTKYCFYSYIDANHIRIKFDRTSYEPKLNYNIKIHLKTTTGEKGNFMYDKDTFYPVSLQSDTIDYNGLSMEIKFITDSIDGVDRKSDSDIKEMLPKLILARETIINNKDIENFFNSLSPFDDKLYFYKKRDNQIERLYYGYMLLKDQNNNIIPSNTINLQIKETQFENNKDARYSFSLRKKFKYVEADNICVVEEPIDKNKHDDVDFQLTRYKVTNDGVNQQFAIPIPDKYDAMNIYYNGELLSPVDYNIIEKDNIVIPQELFKNDYIDIEHIIETTNFDKQYVNIKSFALTVQYDDQTNFVISNEYPTEDYDIIIVRYNGGIPLDYSSYIMSDNHDQINLLIKGQKKGDTISFEFYRILYGIYTEDVPVENQSDHNFIVQYDNQQEFILPVIYPLSSPNGLIINYKISVYYNTKLLDPKEYTLSNDHRKIILKNNTIKGDYIDIYPSVDICDTNIYEKIFSSSFKILDKDQTSFNIEYPTDNKYDMMVIKHNGVELDNRLYKSIDEFGRISFYGLTLAKDDIIECSFLKKKDNITHIYTENIGYTTVASINNDKTTYPIPTPSNNHYNELTNIKIDVAINNKLLHNIEEYTISNDHKNVILKTPVSDGVDVVIGIRESYYDYKYYETFYEAHVKAEQDQTEFNIEYPNGEVGNYDLMIIRHNNDLLYSDAYTISDDNNKINIIGMEIKTNDDIGFLFFKKVDYENDDDLNVDLIESKNFLYSIPFNVVISMSPLTVSYYLLNMNKVYYLKYPYINQNATIQFIATQVNLKRMDLEDPDYVFTMELQQNISLDKGLVIKDKATGKITKCLIKPFLIMNNVKETYYIEGQIINADLDLYRYTVEFRLKTDAIIDKDNRIRVDKLKITGYQDPIETYAYLLQELNMNIYIFAKFDSDFGRDDSDIIFGSKQNAGYTLCNKFTISENVRLLYNFSNIIQSTVLVDNVQETGEYQFTIKHIPAVKYSYIQDPTRYQYVLDYLEFRKAFIDSSLDILENSFCVDLKFFNTYGKARLFTIGRKDQETLDKPNLTLNFDLKLLPGADTYSRDFIVNEIKTYIENINNNIMSIHMSNLCTDIKNKFDTDIDYIEFTGVNKYNSLYQYIEKHDIEDIETVPEFLNINLINNSTPDINITIV